MSVKVYVRNGNLEGALSAFKAKVAKAEILDQWKENQFYTKPSEKRREARKKAVRERKNDDG